jgi:RNA recognition motif-containing protein
MEFVRFAIECEQLHSYEKNNTSFQNQRNIILYTQPKTDKQ